jgi:hypothetical protein
MRSEQRQFRLAFLVVKKAKAKAKKPQTLITQDVKTLVVLD